MSIQRASRGRAWRRATALGLVASAALVLGCGKNRVVLNVNVRSFMNDADVSGSYSAPSVMPVTVRLPPVGINLVEGFKDFGKAEEVSLDVGVRFDNQAGDGRGQFKLYFAADSAAVYAAPPVATIDVALSPGTASTGTAHIAADQRVLELFTSKQMLMGVEFAWQPATLGLLQGTYDISRIDAHVVSKMNLFQ